MIDNKFKVACEMVGVDYYTICRLTDWGIHQYQVDYIIDWVINEAEKRGKSPLETSLLGSAMDKSCSIAIKKLIQDSFDAAKQL